MAVNFPIPDYPDVETLAEMVSRVLLPYSSELGLNGTGVPRQTRRLVPCESLEGISHENDSEDFWPQGPRPAD